MQLMLDRGMTGFRAASSLGEAPEIQGHASACETERAL